MSVLVAVCLVLSFAAYSVSEEMRIDDVSIAFLYESRVSDRERYLEDEVLAGILSQEFKMSRDEFERREMMQTLGPEVKRRLADGAATSEVYLDLGVLLGEYNFEKGGFPTGWSASTYVEYDYSFAVMFDNGAAVSLFPMELEAARELARELRNNRDVVMRLRGDIVGHERRQLNRRRHRVLYINVKSMVMTTAMGSVHEAGGL